ncbi:MAG: hypothetical protein JWR35_3615 [Marmoricola sp.]|jgi:uncharacterized protein (DUF697 family)|nr:hypothetical protein [Marmoricola sp.]
MTIRQRLTKDLAARSTKIAPGLTTSFVQKALDQAIKGVGPLAGAGPAGDKQLSDHDGDVNEAIREVIEIHVRMAGAQGLVTNIGGLVTMTVTVPANITGLALIQCRMVAEIAHLRGYDLDDPRVRNAILESLLGEERMLKLIKQKLLPGTPMVLATAPVYDAHLDSLVATEVASELITKVAGKKLASTIGRRVPVVGGLVGAGTDGFSTWKIGRYADREFLPRMRR